LVYVFKILYDTYTKYLPAGAHILDAGCGSGRDSKILMAQGYTVTAFDGSAAMVKLARDYTGLEVQHLTFNQMTYESAFDGVWANASLLHVPYNQLPITFDNIIKATKKNGIFYASFKVGTGEKVIQDGRHFTFFDEAHMRNFVAQFPELLIEEIFTAEDARDAQPDWLRVYMRVIKA